ALLSAIYLAILAVLLAAAVGTLHVVLLLSEILYPANYKNLLLFSNPKNSTYIKNYTHSM
ncbi:MAG: hypothetical protein LW855_05020, partial [Alphaproteobacteria bacterium]|nr:hypothetical protein [Alphaproteobacteria bacterium]